MSSRKQDMKQGAAQSAKPTADGSEEAVQLALQELRSMGQRFRTASKEQQVLIQATHVQWASMTDAPTPAPYSNVGHTYFARQESVHTERSMHGVGGVNNHLNVHFYAPCCRLAIHTALAGLGYPPKGIASFFSCSGKLFHIFTEEQIAYYQKARRSGLGEQSKNYATCFISAVAAVGLQYLPDGVDMSAEQSLYAVARHYYDFLLEFNPLEAMKVCALFVLYNIFARSTVALAYIEVGLSLCHQFGIDKPASSCRGEQEQWCEYRRIWRTLLFFSR
ncbi:hypothetical protein PG994_005489 [Apiospora phragmitis]|uniref:Transcription factor domain-containing protein n=1 Tax=Apiospora phragmitis TaxID=2905665 RepID=A0ABR1VCG3_9PEZI